MFRRIFHESKRLNADFSGSERCRHPIFLTEFYISTNRCLRAKLSFTGELFLPFAIFWSAKFGRFFIILVTFVPFYTPPTSLSKRSSTVSYPKFWPVTILHKKKKFQNFVFFAPFPRDRRFFIGLEISEQRKNNFFLILLRFHLSELIHISKSIFAR